MKKLLIVFALAIPLIGCPSNTATTAPPLAPGYLNQADQVMGETLAAAHRFYTSIQSQSAAGTITLSASEKQAFNDFGVSLNVADATYLAYHSGQATEAAAQAQVNAVSAKQAALPTPGGK